MLHHDTWKAPEAARYVNFSRRPLGVVAVFAVNAVPFLLGQWIFRNGWAAGVFAGFAVYYIAFEEIHWRSHMGGWLPKWLRFAARHHLLHHAHETGEYNVFLPIFDRIVAGLQTQGRVSTRTMQR
jgi:sterol desaturase/sphingolipid hydroxylase (fatty acid hydroxylase superfamily)